jgi:hypothetical protein
VPSATYFSKIHVHVSKYEADVEHSMCLLSQVNWDILNQHMNEIDHCYISKCSIEDFIKDLYSSNVETFE